MLKLLQSLQMLSRTAAISQLRFPVAKCSNLSKRSTIFALSTCFRMSAIAIVRISGPKANDVLFRMGMFKRLPESRKATLCSIRDPESQELLDKALALWFPGPNSFTGEDVCELHIHGGIAVVRSVLQALEKLNGFRHAEPGEFTKRAFIADKLDLTEVEGLADLLHAETEAQQKLALHQMQGSLYKLYNGWTERLKKCLSRIEAYIDFSEDQHLDNIFLDEVTKDVMTIIEEAQQHLMDKRKGEKIRSGVHAAIVGPPNVGKSSLLNALCQREVAIVSSTAGTTRDVIESSFNLDGFLVNVADTAGIRETSDSIEREGVRRAMVRSSEADLLLVVLEADKVIGSLKNFYSENDTKHIIDKELGEDFLKNLSDSQETNNLDTLRNSTDMRDVIVLLNKVDLLCEADSVKLSLLQERSPTICGISCNTGHGMDVFLNKFTQKVKNSFSGPLGIEPTITQDRHRKCVQQCVQHLSEYQHYLLYDIAISAEKLRNAMNQLGQVTGKVTTEDILDVIFKDFCIGK